jgi:hypothetical protein
MYFYWQGRQQCDLQLTEVLAQKKEMQNSS